MPIKVGRAKITQTAKAKKASLSGNRAGGNLKGGTSGSKASKPKGLTRMATPKPVPSPRTKNVDRVNFGSPKPSVSAITYGTPKPKTVTYLQQ